MKCTETNVYVTPKDNILYWLVKKYSWPFLFSSYRPFGKAKCCIISTTYHQSIKVKIHHKLKNLSLSRSLLLALSRSLSLCKCYKSADCPAGTCLLRVMRGVKSGCQTVFPSYVFMHAHYSTPRRRRASTSSTDKSDRWDNYSAIILFINFSAKNTFFSLFFFFVQTADSFFLRNIFPFTSALPGKPRHKHSSRRNANV